MKHRPFTWSLSALKDYERCPRLWSWRRWLRKPEPPAPALDRGTKLHGLMENALLTGAKLPKTLGKFDARVAELRAQPGVEIEQMWCYDRDWQPVPDRAPATWLRMKLDYFARTAQGKAHVLDWKSGGIYPDHIEGMNLYALGVFMRYPEVEEVTVSLEYLDHKEGRDHVVTSDRRDALMVEFIERVTPLEKLARALTRSATDPAKPTPGPHCRWCSFSKAKGGDCDAGG